MIYLSSNSVKHLAWTDRDQTRGIEVLQDSLQLELTPTGTGITYLVKSVLAWTNQKPAKNGIIYLAFCNHAATAIRVQILSLNIHTVHKPRRNTHSIVINATIRIKIKLD